MEELKIMALIKDRFGIMLHEVEHLEIYLRNNGQGLQRENSKPLLKNSLRG